jgi:hypothetical protein
MQWVVDLFRSELVECPDIARRSIALGLCEQFFTATKAEMKFPDEVTGTSQRSSFASKDAERM